MKQSVFIIYKNDWTQATIGKINDRTQNAAWIKQNGFESPPYSKTDGIGSC